MDKLLEVKARLGKRNLSYNSGQNSSPIGTVRKRSGTGKLRGQPLKTGNNDKDKILYSSEFILEAGLRKRSGHGKPYICPVSECGKAYKNPNGIKYHAQYGHSEKQEFLCSCGKIYSTRHGLMAHKKSHENPEEKFKRATRTKSTPPPPPIPCSSRTTFNSQSALLNWQCLERKKKSSGRSFKMCIELADHIYALNDHHDISMAELDLSETTMLENVTKENSMDYNLPLSPSSVSSTDIENFIDYLDVERENITLGNTHNELVDREIIDDEASITGYSTSSNANGLENMDNIDDDPLFSDTFLGQENGSFNGGGKSELCFGNSDNDNESVGSEENSESSEMDSSSSNHSHSLSNSSTERDISTVILQQKSFLEDTGSTPDNSRSIPTLADCRHNSRGNPIGKLSYDFSFFDHDSFCNHNTKRKRLSENVDSYVANVCAFGGCYELFTTQKEYEHHILEIHSDGGNKMKHFRRLINDVMNPGPDTDFIDFCEYYFPEIANSMETESDKTNNTENTDVKPILTDKSSNDTSSNDTSPGPDNENAVPITNGIQYRFEQIQFKREVIDTAATTENVTCKEKRKSRRKSALVRLVEEEDCVDIFAAEEFQQSSESNSVSVQHSPMKYEEANLTEESDTDKPVNTKNNEDRQKIYYPAEFILEGGLKKRRGSGKPYVCPVPGCDKSYKNPNGIKYHAQYGHSERQELLCSCGRKYQTHHGLMAHKKNPRKSGGKNSAIKKREKRLPGIVCGNDKMEYLPCHN